MKAVLPWHQTARARYDLSRAGDVGFWSFASAICILVCAVATYAASRQFPLGADMLQSYLAAQSILSGNILLTGWHLASDNFVFDETLPLAVLEAIFGRHVSVLTGFSVGIYVLLMSACVVGSVRSSNSFRANAISLATIVLLIGTLRPVADLPMLQPGIHGMSIVISLFSLMLLAALARPDWRHRRLTTWVYALLSVAAIGSDPLTIICAFGPALIVLGYDLLTSESVFMAARLFLLVLACIVVGQCAPQIVAWFGGFRMEATVSLNFVAPSRLSHSFQGVLFGLLQSSNSDVFGKEVLSRDGLLSAVRLAGWLCGILAVASWWRAPNRAALGLLDRMLLAGVAVVTVACLASEMFDRAVGDTPANDVGAATRYLSPVIAFGIVIAARFMPGALDRLATSRLRLTATGVLMVAATSVVAASLAMASSLLQLPSWAAASPYRAVGQYLRGRGLTCGVAAYWDASPVTVLSKNRVAVRAVTGGPGGSLVPFLWLSNDRWYSQMTHPMFAIWHTGQEDSFNVNAQTVAATFGKPMRIEDKFGFRIATLAGSTCDKANPT